MFTRSQLLARGEEEKNKCIVPRCEFFQMNKSVFLCSEHGGLHNAVNHTPIGANDAPGVISMQEVVESLESAEDHVMLSFPRPLLNFLAQLLKGKFLSAKDSAMLYSLILNEWLPQSPPGVILRTAILVTITCYEPWLILSKYGSLVQKFPPHVICYYGNTGEPILAREVETVKRFYAQRERLRMIFMLRIGPCTSLASDFDLFRGL